MSEQSSPASQTGPAVATNLSDHPGLAGAAPPASIIYAVGFAAWKRRHVRTFLQPQRVRFVGSGGNIRQDTATAAVTWGLRLPRENFPRACRVFRLEDGFLRSVGLGAALTEPLSWVKDSRGIYYDANHPSDLEYILRHHPFQASERDRAKALRARLITAGLTKYNLGGESWSRPRAVEKVVLVPGQVETDASITHGATDIRTNLELLQTVRRENPDAFLVYKPHPDVVSGLRKRGSGEDQSLDHCDEVITGASMHELLNEVDEVHTLTSLTGFEALLRGKSVATYGRPFYAGWGLTNDRGMTPETLARRNRPLVLDELVYGVLVKYALYASRLTGHLVEPEQIVGELASWKKTGAPKKSLLLPILRLLQK